MLGFDVRIDDIDCPRVDEYREPLQNTEEKKYGQLRQRWVIRMNKDYYIWQWAPNEKSQIIRK